MADKNIAKGVKVEMDPKLYERVKRRLPRTEFRTVNEYINYVVKEVLDQLEKEEPVYSEEDEKKVKDRLRALGYMN